MPTLKNMNAEDEAAARTAYDPNAALDETETGEEQKGPKRREMRKEEGRQDAEQQAPPKRAAETAATVVPQSLLRGGYAAAPAAAPAAAGAQWKTPAPAAAGAPWQTPQAPAASPAFVLNRGGMPPSPVIVPTPPGGVAIPQRGIQACVHREIEAGEMEAILCGNLKRQSSVSKTERKGWKDRILGQPALTALAYMAPDTFEIHLIHSIAKYWATGNGTAALDGKEIGFAGDVTEYGDPPVAVIVQEQKAWQWLEVTGCFDDAPGMHSFFEEDDKKNRANKWDLPVNSVTTKRELPMILLVSGNVLGFLAEEPRTPSELHKFLCGQPFLQPGDRQMALDWAMAACQPPAGKNDSPFALDMRPVVSACKVFRKWKFERLNGTMGRATTPQTPPQRYGGGGPSNEMQGMFASMQTLAERMAAVAERPPQRAAPSEETGPTAEKMKGKIFDEFERAVLMGFSNVKQKGDLQLVWRELQTSKNHNTARRQVRKKMEQFSVAMNVAIDKTCYFDKKVVMDWMEGTASPGGSDPTLEWAERGICILQCCHRDKHSIEKAKKKDIAMEQSEGNQNYQQALDLTGTKARAPPRTYAELKLAVGTFAAYLWVFWGDECPLYNNVLTLHEILDSKGVQNIKNRISPTKCRKILWAVHHDTIEFYSDEMDPNDFATAKDANEEPAYPRSNLHAIFPEVRYGNAPERGTFPVEWEYSKGADLGDDQWPKRRGGGGGGNGYNGGENGNDNDDPPQDKKGPRKRGKRGGRGDYNAYGNANGGWGRGNENAHRYDDTQHDAYDGGNKEKKRRPEDVAKEKIESLLRLLPELTHVHPKILTMMDAYHRRFRGRVHLLDILNAINKTIQALPVITALVENGQSRICYLEVMGKCTHPHCAFIHVPGVELPYGFVSELCTTIKQGVDYVTRNGPAAPQQRIKADPGNTTPGRKGTPTKKGANKTRGGGKRPDTPGVAAAKE